VTASRTFRDAARDALLVLDGLAEDEAVALWMEVVHGGDTGQTADWDEAFSEVRRIASARTEVQS
jgi:hypothetical protein